MRKCLTTFFLFDAYIKIPVNGECDGFWQVNGDFLPINIRIDELKVLTIERYFQWHIKMFNAICPPVFKNSSLNKILKYGYLCSTQILVYYPCKIMLRNLIYKIQ